MSGRVAVLVLVLVLVLGCAPSPASPVVWVAPEGLSSSEQEAAVAFVKSGIATSNLPGWRIGVQPYPLTFNPPILTADFGVVTSATSITFLDRREIVLTWRRLPDGSIDVEDLPWELAKVRENTGRNQ